MTMNHKSWKITGLIATVVIVLTIPLSLIAKPEFRDEQRSRGCVYRRQSLYRMPSEGIPAVERIGSRQRHGCCFRYFGTGRF